MNTFKGDNFYNWCVCVRGPAAKLQQEASEKIGTIVAPCKGLNLTKVNLYIQGGQLLQLVCWSVEAVSIVFD